MVVQRLRAMRAKSGLTQQQVAEHLNISRGAVGHWETGKNTPSYDMLVAMAKLYDTSAAYLIGETDNPYRNRNALSHERPGSTPPHPDTASRRPGDFARPHGDTGAPSPLPRDVASEADDVEVLSATSAWKQLAPDAQNRVRRLIYVLGREVFQDAVEEHFSRKYAPDFTAYDAKKATGSTPISPLPSESSPITLDYGADAMAIFYAIFGLDGHAASAKSRSTAADDDNVRSVAEKSPSPDASDPGHHPS